MITRKCPHCDNGMMAERSYTKAIKTGRQTIRVHGLLKYVCDACSGESVSREQFKLNKEATAAAMEAATQKSVDAAQLRAFRAKHDLSQKAASRLFGAGESAFAKWESGQAKLSSPAALLFKCAAEVPGVVNHLAELNGLTLPPARSKVASAPVRAVHSHGADLYTTVYQAALGDRLIVSGCAQRSSEDRPTYRRFAYHGQLATASNTLCIAE